jgi:hypothetical protein
MQSKLINHQQHQFLEISTPNSMQLTYTNSAEKQQTFLFAVSFTGRMDMYSDVDTVADYLNAHEGWFCRCAQPMKVEPLEGNNGYTLIVGQFGSLGYEVEPKIGVVLDPPMGRVYRMHTIPIPGYDPSGYDVNYQAWMELTEITVENEATSTTGIFHKKRAIPSRITQVNWRLDLAVGVEFPKFISKLSTSLVQSTGNRLLAQIVRQISPRLTYKVQQDFHTTHDLLMPPKSSRQLEKITQA